MNVKIKKLHQSAVIPAYSKPGDAGLDLTATRVIKDTPTQITYGTDISIEIPEGYVGLIFPRSSIRDRGLYLSNSVGVLDSGYRGEIQFTFIKLTGGEGYYDETRNTETAIHNFYEVGERVGQIIILPYPQIKFEETHTLSTSERGTGGFGHSGK